MRSTVEVQHDGKLVTADVEISGGMITVSNPSLGRKSASESSNNDVLAKILLRELINEADGKGWL